MRSAAHDGLGEQCLAEKRGQRADRASGSAAGSSGETPMGRPSLAGMPVLLRCAVRGD